MVSRPIRVVAGVPATAIIVASLYVGAYVGAQTTPAPAGEASTPAAADAAAPAPEAESQGAEAPAAATPPATLPGPEANIPATEAPFAMPPPVSLPALRTEQLDQLLAPIALYPDALLAQILMAATYPLEIVKARRWLRDPRNAVLSGDQLAAALDTETWDPSVKALVTLPQILLMMDTNLDWTEGLGAAFATQLPDVMDAVQRLRQEAAAAGTLWSNAHQRVTEEGQGIAIEPANPSYIYPPLYNPAFVYGPWPSAEYPPLDIVPPDYGLGLELPFGISFGGGFVIVNKIWRWCRFDWGQRQIRQNVQTSRVVDHAIREPAAAVWRPDPTHGQRFGPFGSDARARLAMFGNHPPSIAAIPHSAVPTVASGPPIVFARPAARAVAPTRMALPALVVPQHRIAGRPMMMPQIAPRQPAARVGPRFVALAKAVPPDGRSHFDGAAHR